MPRNPNLTLDQLLDQKRRAEASKTASAILGKARFGASGKGAITPTRNTTPASKSPNPASQSRIQKSTSIPGLPVSQQTARSLVGNKLFTALHPDAVRVVPSPPSIPSGPKHGDGNGGRLLKPGTKRPSPMRVMGVNGANNGRANQNQNQKNVSQQANRGKNGQNNNQKNGAQNNQDNTMKIRGSTANQLTIKGAAGPAVLQASNFAPGTTAEDIRHHMSSFGNVKSCLVLTAHPTVIAEIVFETMEQGKAVVERFNGVWADGQMLSVTFKTTPPVANLTQITTPTHIIDPFRAREEADRRRREQNIHYQDGTYGVQAPPIYSDDLLRKGRGTFHMLQ